MSAPAFLLIDQGGHASRALLYSDQGALLASAERPITTTRPAPGQVEHDAEQVVASVSDSIEALAAQYSGPIHSAGLSCQRASVVCWSRRSGRALSPVLSWQDTRATAQLQAAKLDDLPLQAWTGLRASPHFGAAKLAWLLQYQPGLDAALRSDDLCWGPLASFLVARLCRQRPYRVAYSIAQRSLVFDIERGSWSSELCRRFALPLDSLPACSPDLFEFGSLQLAKQEVPLRLCSGDQNLLAAALTGCQGGEAALNLGTGGFLLAPGDSAVDGLLRSVLPAADAVPQCALEGTVNGVGAAFDWLAQRRQWSAIPWSALDAVPLKAQQALFLNRVGGVGAPFWQAGREPRFSAPPGSDVEAINAVAESVCFLLRAIIDALRLAAQPIQGVVLGGGLSRSDGLCQRLADTLQCTVGCSAETELSAQGGLRLLRQQAGLPALSALELRARFQPGPESTVTHARFQRWSDALLNLP